MPGSTIGTMAGLLVVVWSHASQWCPSYCMAALCVQGASTTKVPNGHGPKRMAMAPALGHKANGPIGVCWHCCGSCITKCKALAWGRGPTESNLKSQPQNTMLDFLAHKVCTWPHGLKTLPPMRASAP